MSRLSFLVVCIGAAQFSNFAYATVVVDHQPEQAGGPASDTDFINMFGQRRWQLSVDNFVLPTSLAITEVRWWGFYDQDNPPTTETIRIRFYEPRAGDGLPGALRFEELVVDPSRDWTGRLVIHSINSREYLYSYPLSVPFAASGGQPYWLEVTQIGDVETAFRWEYALADWDSFAFRNVLTSGEWTYSALDVDLAFQLVIPEPSSLGLLTLSFLWVARRRLGCAVRPAA